MVAPLVIAAIISAAATAGGTVAGWNRNKPRETKLDTARSDALRARQLSLLDTYTRSAQGKSASWADLQMQKMLTQANAAQSAQAASTRGNNIALAQRTAANVAGANLSTVAAETARARLQEQEQNRAQAADLAGQIRGTDLQIESAILQQKNLFDQAVAARKAANRELLSKFFFSVGASAGDIAKKMPQSAAKAGANQAEYDNAYNSALTGAEYSNARAAQGNYPAGGSTVILGSGGGNNPYSSGDAGPTPLQTYNPYDFGSNTNTGSPYQQYQFRPNGGYRR